MSIYDFLVLTHIIGTAVGVGGATFIEIFFINALRDGVMDPDEGTTMQISYNVLRIAFYVLILSGFGFLILARIAENNEWFYSPQFWVKLSIVAIIALNAALIQLRAIPLLWGSALALTSWYAALILGVLRGNTYPVWGVVLTYVASIVIIYFVLRAIHAKYVPHKTA